MTGKELLSRFILTINQYLGFNNEFVLKNIIVDKNLSNALAILKTLTNNADFVKLIDSLDKIILADTDNFLSSNYSVSGTIQVIDFALPIFEKKNRAFAYSDSDFGFFSTKSLLQGNSIVDISLPQFAMLWKQIQEFLERCYAISNEDKITILLDCIKNGNIHTGFVINKNGIVFDDNRHYSYIYL